MTHGDAKSAAAWVRADQAALLTRVLDRSCLRLVTAGGEGGREVARLRDAKPSDDLRAMLASTDAGVAIIGDPAGFADGTNTKDFRTIVEAAQRGLTIISLEPIPPLSLHLSDPAWRDASDVARERIAFSPLARRGAAFRRAQDVLDSFGPIEAVSIVSLGRLSEGSLGSRLTGACDLLLALLGEPISVDAAHTPGPDDPATPETLRGLHGHLAATFRFDEGHAASLFASDRAAAWSRTITLLGPGGRIVADDRRVEWYDAAGLHVETMNAGIEADADLAAAVIADDISAMLGDAPRTAPVDLAGVLSAAHAALLSARTGHAEMPSALRRIGGS
ncbi:MAG: hypothetical protein AAFR96_10515 [Planctomycetota bacterium]